MPRITPVARPIQVARPTVAGQGFVNLRDGAGSLLVPKSVMAGSGIINAGSGGSGNMGQVGSYADMNLSTYPIYTIDLGLNDYNIFIRNEGSPGSVTKTHNASGWPLGGGAYVRLTPPTVNQMEGGFNVGNLWRGATLAIQEFNYRFETRWNSTLASITNGPKYCITHTRRALDGGADAQDRPMIFLSQVNGHADNAAYRRNNTLSMCPGQGTTQGWGPGPYGDTWGVNLWFYTNSQLGVYFTNAGDTGTFNSRSLIPAGEVVTIEKRIITTTDRPGYPRGLIAYRVYRENGEIYESGCPWDWDDSVPFGTFVTEIQQAGCGEFNTAPGSNAQWFDIGTYFTMARNFGGWLGRRGA